MKRFFSSAFQAIGILSVGLFVRYRMGPSMFDPFFFIPFSCFSAILAGPLLIRLNEQSQEPVPVQVRRAVTRACLWISLILLVSILSLNFMPWGGEWLLPEWTTVLDAALLSVTATTAMAALMALLLSRLPPRVAKWFFRALVFVAILLYSAAPAQWTGHTIETVLERGLSTVALTVAATLALLDAGLLRLLARSSIAHK
jgi:drug/metabolite transporter (DMT)-like permease